MAIDFKMNVHGLQSVEEKLRQLEPRLRRKVLFGAVSSGAKIIRIEAQARANFLFKRHTGALSRGIQQRARTFRTSAGTQVGARITFRRPAWYGRLLGSGWNHVGRARRRMGRKTKSVPGRPFMHPAFVAKGVEAVNRIAAVLRERLGIALRA